MSSYESRIKIDGASGYVINVEGQICVFCPKGHCTNCGEECKDRNMCEPKLYFVDGNIQGFEECPHSQGIAELWLDY